MNLVELLQYLATQAGWSILASFLVQAIKKLWPQIIDDVAQALSVLVAVFVGLVAKELIPYAVELPEVVSLVIIAVGTQLWYKFVKWLEQNGNGEVSE